MMRVSILLLLACATCLVGSTASAAVIITGNLPGNPDFLLHGTAGGAGGGSGPIVSGELGSNPNDNTGFFLDMSYASKDLVYKGGAGQATLLASIHDDGSASTNFGSSGVTFEANPTTPFGFNLFELNVFAAIDGVIRFDVFLSDATSASGIWSLDGNGENRMNIYTDAGEVITKIIATTMDINNSSAIDNIMNIKQIRLNAVAIPGSPDPVPVPSPVPEPASMLVWTLAGITGMAYRYRVARRAA